MLKIIIVSSSLITLIATNNLVMAQQADYLKLNRPPHQWTPGQTQMRKEPPPEPTSPQQFKSLPPSTKSPVSSSPSPSTKQPEGIRGVPIQPTPATKQPTPVYKQPTPSTKLPKGVLVVPKQPTPATKQPSTQTKTPPTSQKAKTDPTLDAARKFMQKAQQKQK